MKIDIKDVSFTTKEDQKRNKTVNNMQNKEKTDFRTFLYSIVQTDKKPTLLNKIYSAFILVMIFLSIVPLCFKVTSVYSEYFDCIERVTVVVFLFDYILRWVTADIKYKRFGKKAFWIYPFRFHAIIDLLAILPGIIEMCQILKLLRIIRGIKCVRVFKALKYSSSFNIITKILKKQKKALLTVVFMAVAYIFISAIFIYQIEPETFDTFFDAVYWATISLTTVGYGDLYPVSVSGRMFSMITAFFGIAFVALPAGIISAGYLEIVMETKGKES